MFLDDTIAAIATAPGEAGIGIVRISGEKAIEIIDKIFRSKKDKKLSQYKPRILTFNCSLSFLYFSCNFFNSGCISFISLTDLVCFSVKGMVNSFTTTVNNIMDNP